MTFSPLLHSFSKSPSESPHSSKSFSRPSLSSSSSSSSSSTKLSAAAAVAAAAAAAAAVALETDLTKSQSLPELFHFALAELNADRTTMRHIANIATLFFELYTVCGFADSDYTSLGLTFGTLDFPLSAILRESSAQRTVGGAFDRNMYSPAVDCFGEIKRASLTFPENQMVPNFALPVTGNFNACDKILGVPNDSNYSIDNMTNAISWSCDGEYLAICFHMRQFDIHHVETGLKVCQVICTSVVFCLAWSTVDNQVIATGSDDNKVRIWEAELVSPALVNPFEPQRKVGKKCAHLLRCLQGHASDLLYLAWSLDGALLASVEIWGTVIVWDMQRGGRPVRHLKCVGEVDFLRWTTDGCLVGGRNEHGEVWNAETGAFLYNAPINNTTVMTPNGQLLIQHNFYLDVLSARSGAKLSQLEYSRVLPEFGRVFFAVSADSKYLACRLDEGTHGAFSIWDLKSGKLVQKLAGWKTIDIYDSPAGLAWSPNGLRLVSCNMANTAHVWDMAASETISNTSLPSSPALSPASTLSSPSSSSFFSTSTSSTALSPSSSLLSGASPGVMSSQRRLALKFPNKEHIHAASRPLISLLLKEPVTQHGGRCTTVTEKGLVQVWNFAQGDVEREYQFFPDERTGFSNHRLHSIVRNSNDKIGYCEFPQQQQQHNKKSKTKKIHSSSSSSSSSSKTKRARRKFRSSSSSNNNNNNSSSNNNNNNTNTTNNNTNNNSNSSSSSKY